MVKNVSHPPKEIRCRTSAARPTYSKTSQSMNWLGWNGFSTSCLNHAKCVGKVNRSIAPAASQVGSLLWARGVEESPCGHFYGGSYPCLWIASVLLIIIYLKIKNFNCEAQNNNHGNIQACYCPKISNEKISLIFFLYIYLFIYFHGLF